MVIHDLEQRQLVAPTDFIVIAIMGRGDLEGAGAEILFDLMIEYHRDNPVGEGQADALAGQGAVALIVGMDRNRGITEHRFRPGRRHHHVAGTVGIRVANMVELALGLLVFDLVVGQGGMAARAPVDDVVSLVDQAFLIQADKNLADGGGQPGIHGEAFALPVTGRAQPLQLVDDRPAFLRPPAPDLFDEGLAAEVVTAFAFQGQLTFDDVLGGDAGVIGAGNPHGIVAAHPVITGEDILEGIVQGVANVEDAGDVGWGDDDGEGGSAWLHGRRKALFLLPALQPLLFNFAKFIALAQQLFFVRCHVSLMVVVNSVGPYEKNRPLPSIWLRIGR